MHSQLHFLSLSSKPLTLFPSTSIRNASTLNLRQNDDARLCLHLPSLNLLSLSLQSRAVKVSSMASNSNISNCAVANGVGEPDLDLLAEVGNKVADAAGEVIRKYFRSKFEILDKEDLSPVTIADRTAEEAMVSIILENFPSHAIFGEENGWRCEEKFADYVWVLDPIDGTKSFITGKPLFGTLIALLHRGKPILGIIDQPILKERWIGISGKRTTLNGQEVSTRSCAKLSQAYLYYFPIF